MSCTEVALKDIEMIKMPIERVLEPCIPPGDNLVTLVAPLERRWVGGTWGLQGEQIYEHIAYELRYGNLSSIEHGSICMKAYYFI